MSFWLYVLLIIVHIIQIYFWIYVYNRHPNQKVERTESSDSFPSVSIVIAAKNEAANLLRLLPQVLVQDYPTYEVIVVDDHSSDNSIDTLKRFGAIHPHLVLLSANGHHGKKKALSLGIQKAHYPWILCTDADCLPQSNLWVKTMMHQYADADIILGYGPYQKQNSFLNAFVEYETWYIALQYLTAALHNRAYMGVGRNLCFKKKLFEDIGGYSAHGHLPSGDDDLFVGALSDKKILLEIDSKAWTFSVPATSFKEMWQQKRRHLTTASSYSRKNQFLLSLNYTSILLLYCATALLCVKGYYLALLLLVFRWIYLYVVSHPWMRRLDVMRLWPFLPFWDLLLVIYYTAHGVMMWWPKKDW